METIFTNTENNKTNEPHLNLFLTCHKNKKRRKSTKFCLHSKINNKFLQ